MWKVPSCGNLERTDNRTIQGNKQRFEDTQADFHSFTKNLLKRLGELEVAND